MAATAVTAPAAVSARPGRSSRPGQRRAAVISHGILTLYAICVLVPLLFVVYLSVKSLSGILATPTALPDRIHTENYTQAWSSADLGRYLINTVVVAGVTVAVVLLLSSLAAYVIARYHFRGNQLLYLFFVSGLALPIQIIALPLFILMRQLGLLDTLPSLILVFAAGGMSFSVFLLVNFMRSIPMELQEAAVVDGAGPIQVYWHVVLPLVRPALGIVAIFEFINAWKEFFLPLLLIQSTNNMTVSVGVQSFQGEFDTQWQLLLAALVIVSLPTIIGALFVTKQLRRNLLSGGIKM
ncbi:MAG TPA: carbohydrate ABC transporter permease [Actinocrinis sp.]|jgi:raffinose/stachyose/melibiose transport system permease protein